MKKQKRHNTVLKLLKKGLALEQIIEKSGYKIKTVEKTLLELIGAGEVKETNEGFSLVEIEKGKEKKVLHLSQLDKKDLANGANFMYRTELFEVERMGYCKGLIYNFTAKANGKTYQFNIIGEQGKRERIYKELIR